MDINPISHLHGERQVKLPYGFRVARSAVGQLTSKGLVYERQPHTRVTQDDDENLTRLSLCERNSLARETILFSAVTLLERIVYVSQNASKVQLTSMVLTPS